ncbi:MAG: ATP-dependent helicase HrpB, partial [Gammaproteobacteria bacterium]
LPVHPRLAHLLLRGAACGLGAEACWLASLLSERDPFSQENPEIEYRLEILAGDIACPPQQRGWQARTRQLATQLKQQLAGVKSTGADVAYLLKKDQLSGFLLACAYPDRIARRRHSGGYQLANGRSAGFADATRLDKYRWLAVAEVSAVVGGKGDVIRSAAALDEKLFDTALEDLVHDETFVDWDKQAKRFVAEARRHIGSLVLQKQALDEVPVEEKTAALIRYLQDENLEPLAWSAELHQWCARVNLLHSIEPQQGWPDLSRSALQASLDDWLGPYLDKVSSLQDFKKLDLASILKSLLSWEQQRRLEQLAPARYRVPSGSSIAIDYGQSPPVLAVKLQEMFGCEQTPAVADGRVPLVVHLLSPAGRPLQITQDLAGFWRTSYHEVKKEMKGRYPKHPWPDDPLVAVATRKTKRNQPTR